MRIRIGKWFVGAVVAAALVVVVGVVFGLTVRETRAEKVQVREQGNIVGLASGEDAIADASKRVGFPVRVPTTLPDKDLKLEYVDTDVGPPGVASPLKKATLVYVARTASGASRLLVQIEETGVRFGEPVDRATRLDPGVPGVDLYHQETNGADGYWLLTKERGFMIVVSGPQRPAQPAVIPMLRSLVQ